MDECTECTRIAYDNSRKIERFIYSQCFYALPLWRQHAVHGLLLVSKMTDERTGAYNGTQTDRHVRKHICVILYNHGITPDQKWQTTFIQKNEVYKSMSEVSEFVNTVLDTVQRAKKECKTLYVAVWCNKPYDIMRGSRFAVEITPLGLSRIITHDPLSWIPLEGAIVETDEDVPCVRFYNHYSDRYHMVCTLYLSDRTVTVGETHI